MSTLKTNQIQTTSGQVILNSTGSILQTAFSEGVFQVTNSAAQTYTVIASTTLTTVKSNSKFFMTGYAHGYGGVAALSRGNLGFAIQENGQSVIRLAGVDGANGDSWGTDCPNGAQFNRSFEYNSSYAAGSFIFVFLLGAGWDRALAWNYSGYGHKSCITVMEVSS